MSKVRRSDSTAKLDEALAKAIQGFTEVLKENENPFFKSKYADLSSVIAATRSHLAKHGVSLRQWPFTEEGRAGITSRLCCQGEWEEADFSLPLTGKQDAQAVGSAITYARRYATQSVLCVAAETDDDANSAVAEKITKSTEQFEQRSEGQQRIPKFKVDELERRWKANGWTPLQVSEYLKKLNGYVQLEEIQKQDAEAAMQAFSKAPDGKEELTKPLQDSLDAIAKPMPKAPAKRTGDPFWNSLWASAKKHGISEQDVHQWAREQFGMRESLKELNQVQLGRVIEWIASVEP